MFHFYITAKQCRIENYNTDESEKFIDMFSVYDESKNTYAIDNYVEYISKLIYNAISDDIDKSYSYSVVKSLFNRGGKFKFRSESDVKVVLNIDIQNHTYSYTKRLLRANIYTECVYAVAGIDDEDLGYLVSEYIRLDNELITKCYHPVFLNSPSVLSDINKYIESETDINVKTNCVPMGEFKIFPVNCIDIESSEWYSLNMQVAELMRKYDIPRKEYRLISDLNYLSLKIKADSYHNLSAGDKYLADRMLFERIMPYVDPNVLDDLCGGDVTLIDPDTMFDSVNMCIMFALADARSQEEFFKIHDVLGPYSSRIKELNHKFSTHKGEGFVLVTKTGQIRWYAECNFINSWYFARGNPYYHKFQKNEAALKCFTEYHPELFVDDFPSDELFDKYRMDYNNHMNEQRREHQEARMRYYPNEKNLACFGIWYCNGVDDDISVDDAKFFAFYYEYKLSIDQCKVLLNNEELVVDDYETEYNEKITIRFRLREATRYKEYYNCEIYRCDQSPEERQTILLSMEVGEPSNPYA